MDSLKKSFNRAKQTVDEKLGGAERTELEPSLQKTIQKLDDVKQYTMTMVSAVEAYSQPDPTVRILPGMKVESANKPEVVGIETGNLSNRLGQDDKYGAALKSASECFNKLGQAEREFLDAVQTKYIAPVRKFLNEEIKSVETEKKQTETKRLDMDSLKAKMKGKEPSAEDTAYQTALESYQTQVAQLKEVADAVEAKVPELHAAMKALIDADIDYSGKRQQILKDLSKNI